MTWYCDTCQEKLEACECGLPCAWCAKVYKAIWAEYNQAVNCASTVWFQDGQWFVQGHYGSAAHDTTRYRFTRFPPIKDADPVCDACVTARLEQGDLEEVPGSFL